MSVKKIKKYNSPQFLIDIKSVRDVLVMPASGCAFFRVNKRQVLKEAESEKINYYMTDKIFVVKRNTMVII